MGLFHKGSRCWYALYCLSKCYNSNAYTIASALDYAKSLRIITQTLHKTTLASFYQASESIYEKFDRVLVLDKGRCIFFGPAKEAKPYFEELGFECERRKSTPDFLTGITNPQERRIREGAQNVPVNSVDLEAAYKSSPYYERAMRELRDYEAQLKSEVIIANNCGYLLIFF